jgi:hypothetical protein
VRNLVVSEHVSKSFLKESFSDEDDRKTTIFKDWGDKKSEKHEVEPTPPVRQSVK